MKPVRESHSGNGHYGYAEVAQAGILRTNTPKDETKKKTVTFVTEKNPLFTKQKDAPTQPLILTKQKSKVWNLEILQEIREQAKKGNAEAIRKLFEEMGQIGQKPDTKSYHYLIQAYLKRKELDQALKVVDEMGETVDKQGTFLMILDTLIKEQQVDCIDHLLDVMIEKGMSIDLTICHAILSLYIEKRDLETVEGFIKKMPHLNVKPDLSIYNRKTDAYALDLEQQILRSLQNGHFKDCIHFFYQIVQAGRIPSDDILREFVNKCPAREFPSEFDKFLKEGIPIGDYLICEYLDQNKIEDAIATYEYMENECYLPTQSTLTQLIQKCVTKGYYSQAIQLSYISKEKYQHLLPAKCIYDKNLQEQIINQNFVGALVTLGRMSVKNLSLSVETMIQFQKAYLSVHSITEFETTLFQILSLGILDQVDEYFEYNLDQGFYLVTFAILRASARKGHFPPVSECERYIQHFLSRGLVHEAFLVHQITSNGRELNGNTYGNMLDLVNPSLLG